MTRAQLGAARREPRDASQLESIKVLHLLPLDLYRGIQVTVKTLRHGLDERAGRHELLTLFAGTDETLRREPSLGVPQGLPRRLGFDPRAFVRLRRHIAKTRPAVVVAHGGEALKYAALARGGAKLVYHSIGVASGHLETTGRSSSPSSSWGDLDRSRDASLVGRLTARLGSLKHGLTHLVYRVLISRCSAVVCVSESVATGLRHNRLAGKLPISIIPAGRDPGRFAADPVASDPPRIAWVSSWDSGKQPARFIAMAERLRSTGSSFSAVMAGEGPEREQLTPRASCAGIDVVGPLDDVPGLLASCDMFVFTSTGRAEGLPGVLIEAGLAGLPTVTYDVPGARDIVADGRTGFVVRSSDELVDRVQHLLVRATERRSFGAAGRLHCAKYFGLASSLDDWEELLTSVLP